MDPVWMMSRYIREKCCFKKSHWYVSYYLEGLPGIEVIHCFCTSMCAVAEVKHQNVAFSHDSI